MLAGCMNVLIKPSRYLLAQVKYSTMPSRLSGKVALITASTDGIGFGIAKRLAQEGAEVVISSRKQKNVDQALKELKGSGYNAIGRVCHVGKLEDQQALVDMAINEKGKIDILVSNAGINPFMGHILDTPDDIWDKIFDINVKSAFQISKLVLPHMEKEGSGVIIYVSSFVGFRPLDILGAYSVSKTALLGLTKAVASQCAPLNIRVNSLCPGLIQTKFSQALVQHKDILNIPLVRLGTPEDCANMSKLKSFHASMRLLDSMILTVLLYAAPIWAHDQALILDRIQDTFLRRFLCLPSYTPGYILRAETGRNSLDITVRKLTLKFWTRILKMDGSRLPSICLAHLWDISISSKQIIGLVKSITELLNNTGFSWLVGSTDFNVLQRCIPLIIRTATDQSLQLDYRINHVSLLKTKTIKCTLCNGEFSLDFPHYMFYCTAMEEEREILRQETGYNSNLPYVLMAKVKMLYHNRGHLNGFHDLKLVKQASRMIYTLADLYRLRNPENALKNQVFDQRKPKNNYRRAIRRLRYL
ncbi:DHRS2 [Cordylochernes scorpioides]|uniref:DHRS2 n=1 Tax=Cordylochernes scorpioides TaxID=51811 RepID=A0ABY6KDA3_9ARAC|nr:DHRS2 [Cordylochernes scorpioides]